MPDWLPWPNAMLLMAPIIAWNVVLGPLLPSTFPNDQGVSSGLLAAEAATRIGVFAGPMLLSFGWESVSERSGLALYTAGLVVYFASWIPHLLEVGWSSRPIAAIAPYATPALVLISIAIASASWWYGAVAIGFVACHIAHGVTVWHTRW